MGYFHDLVAAQLRYLHEVHIPGAEKYRGSRKNKNKK